MNYSKRDVVIGFIIIILIVVGAFYYRKTLRDKKISNTLPTPISISFKKELENKFKFDIPDNTNSIELKDVSDGNGRGIATDTEVLADIEDPATNYFYQAWLQKGDSIVSLGKLEIAKGGWLLEYNRSKLNDAEKIVISLEKIFDNKLEKRVLEGSFK